MNTEDLQQRLEMLVQADVISNRASEVTKIAFQHLLDELQATDVEQAEMLFTHLPTALTRMEKGEDLEGPGDEIMREVKNSPYYSRAAEQINVVENEWGRELPLEEKDFLSMHYTNVMQLNEGGKA